MQTINLTGRNYLLDLPSNQLTFLDSRFYVTPEGNYWPSITTYLEAYPKGAQYFEWLKKHGEDADAIRDEAGQRGSTVHRLTEEYDNGLEVSMITPDGRVGFKLSEWGMFEKYVEFRKSTDSTVVHNELQVVSDTIQAGGTVDRVMDINGKRYVLDIKTSGAIYSHYWLQVVAYQKMLQEKGIETDGVAILWLNAKTRGEGKKGAIQGKGWQLLTCDDREEIATHWRRFQACKMLWLAENEDSKPRQLTYSLKHQL